MALPQGMIGQADDLSAQERNSATFTIRAQKLQAQQDRQQKRQKLLNVPATLEVVDYWPDGSSVRFRRVAAPDLKPVASTRPVSTLTRAGTQSLPISGSQVPASALVAVSLTITDTPDGNYLLQWNQGSHQWLIQTNFNLQGLQLLHHIPVGDEWLSVFVMNMASQFESLPRQSQKPLIHYDILSQDAPEELNYQIEALHDYYVTHRKQLRSQARRNRALEQARQDWEATHPETPQETVINFFKIR